MRAASRMSIQSSIGPLVWAVDFTALPLGTLVTLPSGLVIARASASTDSVQTSASTLVTGIAANVARIGNNGSGQGLVLEESRTNNVIFSRDPSQVGASKWGAALVDGAITPAYAAGPDGTAGTGCRMVVASGGFGRYSNVAMSTGVVRAVTAWQRRANGGGAGTWHMHNDSAAYIGGALTETWQRNAMVPASLASGSVTSPVDSQDTSGALDVVTDMLQNEVGGFSTEHIVTGAAAVTRAGDRLTHPASQVLTRSGRLGMEIKLRPKGSSSAYTTNPRIWTVDASNYCEIDKTTRVVTVVVAGVTRTLGALPTWAAGDTVEVFVEAGGGTLLTNGAARVNGGATTQLGTGAAQASIANASIDLCSNGTAAQFSAWLQSIKAHRPGHRPSWA